jgi:hypothetical protein
VVARAKRKSPHTPLHGGVPPWRSGLLEFVGKPCRVPHHILNLIQPLLVEIKDMNLKEASMFGIDDK